jgi:hypothetical protein
MAATEYARGRQITVQPVPKEIMFFSLAKEFGWLPSQIENESTKNIKGVMHVLSTYNKIMNQEMEKANRKRK